MYIIYEFCCFFFSSFIIGQSPNLIVIMWKFVFNPSFFSIILFTLILMSLISRNNDNHFTAQFGFGILEIFWRRDRIAIVWANVVSQCNEKSIIERSKDWPVYIVVWIMMFLCFCFFFVHFGFRNHFCSLLFCW